MLLPSAAAGSQHLSRHLFWNSSSRIGRRARGGGSVSLMAGYFFGLDSEIWRLPVCPASFHGMHETLLAYTVIGVNTHTDGISTRQIHWESSCAMCPRVTCTRAPHFSHVVWKVAKPLAHTFAITWWLATSIKYLRVACGRVGSLYRPQQQLSILHSLLLELGRSLRSVTKSPL
jgi:hypothetical protein